MAQGPLSRTLLCHQALERIFDLGKPNPSGEVYDGDIEDDKRAEDPKISPVVAVLDAEAFAELVASLVLAELAHAIRPGLNISTCLFNVWLDVLVARGVRRRVESCKLTLFAVHRLIVDDYA